ncbi:unnamed protein product [Angiostrongylus costaricensis]|uniref:MH1 domain-containing protein n=1 Tax=Angiostrongylus costaricensis TaxID=334426 RepID=A0A0R3Q109_ANGCS|nr:unnamed protein product [Angiostrongylus costaricensis]
MVTTCAYNARTLASESSMEDLLMQARRIRYDVIGLSETRRRPPFNAVYDTGEQLFLGTCDSRVGGVGVLVNTSLSTNIDSFEQLTTRMGRLRLKRRGSIPALIIFVVYAPTLNYDEVEALYMDLEKYYREDYTFFKVITGDFNAKISKTGPRRTSEERRIGTRGLEWNEQELFYLTSVSLESIWTMLCSRRFDNVTPDQFHKQYNSRECTSLFDIVSDPSTVNENAFDFTSRQSTSHYSSSAGEQVNASPFSDSTPFTTAAPENSRHQGEGTLEKNGSKTPISRPYASDACTTIVAYLMQFNKSADEEFSRKAIESLTKKLKDKRDELDALIACCGSEGKEADKCVTIARTLDGRLQRASREAEF